MISSWIGKETVKEKERKKKSSVRCPRHSSKPVPGSLVTWQWWWLFLRCAHSTIWCQVLPTLRYARGSIRGQRKVATGSRSVSCWKAARSSQGSDNSGKSLERSQRRQIWAERCGKCPCAVFTWTTSACDLLWLIPPPVLYPGAGVKWEIIRR